MTPRARSTTGATSTTTDDGHDRHPKKCAWDAPLTDPPGSTKGIISAEKILAETCRVNEMGVDRPIKDELEIMDFIPKDQAVEGTPTSEEETELGNAKGAKKRHRLVGLRPHHAIPQKGGTETLHRWGGSMLSGQVAD